MRRRGFTLLEILIVAGLSMMVLGAAYGLLKSGSGMSQAALSSTALQDAMILEESIVQDILQMGANPDDREILRISESGLSFYKIAFAGDEEQLLPVRYTRVQARPGIYLLVRTEIGPAGKRSTHRFRQTPLSECRFTLVHDKTFGNLYLHAELAVIQCDPTDETRARVSGLDRSSHHCLVLRLPVPSQLGNPKLNLAGRVHPVADFLPLE